MKKEINNISTDNSHPLSEDEVLPLENIESKKGTFITDNPLFDLKEISDIFNTELNDIYDNFTSVYEKSKKYMKER